MMAEPELAGATIDAARRAVASVFRSHHLETPDLDARLLVGAALGLDHTGLSAQAARTLTQDEEAEIGHFVARRLAHEPVARILGYKEFWSMTFRLSHGTLVPRPDTETVVAAALDHLQSRPPASKPPRIADLGTGSGAILLALLSELPDATGIGTDISADALVTAEANARDFGLSERADFIRCDYASALSGPFDAIVSNPPYIPSSDIATLSPDVRDYDPRLALDGGADGLAAYRRIAAQGPALLVPGGALIVEVGFDQAADVSRIMHEAGLAVPGASRTDAGGVERVVTGLKSAV